jgi:antitoxin (DNA-binding transcriptional repressor) of toxin-antitoxin stability system
MNAKSVKQIGMREFLRNIKDIKTAVLKGEEFEVLDHTTPVFRIVPIGGASNKKYTFADLSEFQFTDASKTLALDIDTFVYEK